jgi:hypothetical protein
MILFKLFLAYKFTSSKDGRISAKLLKSNGSVALTRLATAQKENNRMEINATGLTKGMYFIMLKTPDGIIKDKG